MGLKERITEDIKVAQKSNEPERLGVLRFLLAQIKNREIEKGAQQTGLPDAEVLAVLQKEAKKRREAIELFKQGKREDLAEKEAAELKVLEAYLPAQLTRADIEKVIDELHKGGLTDLNGLMKAVMQKLAGQADGKLVREIISQKLEAGS